MDVYCIILKVLSLAFLLYCLQYLLHFLLLLFLPSFSRRFFFTICSKHKMLTISSWTFSLVSCNSSDSFWHLFICLLLQSLSFQSLLNAKKHGFRSFCSLLTFLCSCNLVISSSFRYILIFSNFTFNLFFAWINLQDTFCSMSLLNKYFLRFTQ